MNHQTNNCHLVAPCIIESGILVNKEDIKRLLNDLTQVRYVHDIDGVVQNQGQGWILEVFNDLTQATMIVNNSLYINIQSFDYLKVNQVSPYETHFDLIQDNRTIRLIPMATGSQEHQQQTSKNLGFSSFDEMMGEVFSAKWDVQSDEDFV